MIGFSAEKSTSGKRDTVLEDEESLLAEDETALQDTPIVRISSRGPSWIVTTVLVICTAVLSVVFGAWISRHGQHDPDAFSIQHVSEYSPIIKDIGVHFNRVRFNGSLLAANVFRQDAGPEVDAAWKSLGADFNAVRIPVSEAAKSNLAPDQVKIKEKYGGGYPANVEGLHHLHCLNLLRKSLAWNIEYYQEQGLGPFSNPQHILKHHVTHCLDILRQQLMCTVDIGVLGQVWYQPSEKPAQAFVDFNTMHTCRNFETIRDWAKEHQLPNAKDTPGDFLEPPRAGDRIWSEVP
ncbi:tat pathway signal sequence [Stagonosporopsis vannaccii]|nr:tat pathway signal sequence [Stagonosporopsis vannaccii]